MLDIAIVGASGYTGGELLRILLKHPEARIRQATSSKLAGERVSSVHPNLRKGTELRFTPHDALEPADAILNCSPHGTSMLQMERFLKLAPRVVDLSADFRLRSAEEFEKWYAAKHRAPELLREAVLGIPELHRKEIRAARLVATPGCIATSAIIPLQPLFAEGIVRDNEAIVDSKIGSSAAGRGADAGGMHAERSGVVRAYAPAGHRHQAEIEQELSVRGRARIHLTAHAVELVRGISTTSHVFLTRAIDEKEVWKLLRARYGEEPFVRIVKERTGLYRLPEPKLLAGTNFIDIGFARAADTERLVIVSAIDNLGKGAAGQAVQCLNVMHGFPETTGLEFPGLHPL